LWLLFNAMPLLLYRLEGDAVPLVLGPGWATAPVWTGGEKPHPQRHSLPGPFTP